MTITDNEITLHVRVISSLPFAMFNTKHSQALAVTQKQYRTVLTPRSANPHRAKMYGVADAHQGGVQDAIG